MNKECALQDRLGPGREPSDNMAPPAYLKQPKREPSPEKYPYAYLLLLCFNNFTTALLFDIALYP